MLRLSPTVTQSSITPNHPLHRPVRFGMQGKKAERTDSFECSQLEPIQSPVRKKDKGKGLPPEIIRQRELLSTRLNAAKVCTWLRANLEDDVAPLDPEAALLWSEVLNDEPDVRKKHIDTVFDGRSLVEGKKILEQKKQAAIAGLAKFPMMAKTVEVVDHPDMTRDNVKALLHSTVEECYAYIHPREWLARVEQMVPEPTSPQRGTSAPKLKGFAGKALTLIGVNPFSR